MSTAFNIGLEIEERQQGCPEKLHDQAIDFLKKQSLTGNKHVNQYGLLLDGYDYGCTEYREGKMNIFYFEGDETILDSIKKIKYKNPSINESNLEAISIAEESTEHISKSDPSILIVPWKNYRASPACKSMSILTPMGWQGVHYHTKDKGSSSVFRLFKPRNEKNWYDFDTLKEFASSHGISSEIIFRDGVETPNGFKSFQDMGLLEITAFALQERKRRKNFDFAKKLYHDPDSIAKIPRFIKQLK